MKPNDKVRFSTRALPEMSARQAAAVAGEVGRATAVETRNGEVFVDVEFPKYGGSFGAVPIADLELVASVGFVRPTEEGEALPSGEPAALFTRQTTTIVSATRARHELLIHLPNGLGDKVVTVECEDQDAFGLFDAITSEILSKE